MNRVREHSLSAPNRDPIRTSSSRTGPLSLLRLCCQVDQYKCRCCVQVVPRSAVGVGPAAGAGAAGPVGAPGLAGRAGAGRAGLLRAGAALALARRRPRQPRAAAALLPRAVARHPFR